MTSSDRLPAPIREGCEYSIPSEIGVYLDAAATLADTAQDATISKWCTSRGKRVFDFAIAFFLLLVAAPIMVLAALAVMTSPGPLFFASERLGQGGRLIRVWKFRTMHHQVKPGLQLTRNGDRRITAAGRFLRQWKIDELPQFMNVLCGNMSLVGPRPDSAEFMNALAAKQRSILALKPGIVSVATLRFRDEEHLLAAIPEAELSGYYVKTLLPEKIRLDLDYARRATMLTDLGLTLKTALAILS